MGIISESLMGCKIITKRQHKNSINGIMDNKKMYLHFRSCLNKRNMHIFLGNVFFISFISSVIVVNDGIRQPPHFCS